MNENKESPFPKLEPVIGSSYCQFSIVENNQARLYRNQEKIYNLLKFMVLLQTENVPFEIK